MWPRGQHVDTAAVQKQEGEPERRTDLPALVKYKIPCSLYSALFCVSLMFRSLRIYLSLMYNGSIAGSRQNRWGHTAEEDAIPAHVSSVYLCYINRVVVSFFCAFVITLHSCNLTHCLCDQRPSVWVSWAAWAKIICTAVGYEAFFFLNKCPKISTLFFAHQKIEKYLGFVRILLGT